jgi:hypothetical protein
LLQHRHGALEGFSDTSLETIAEVLARQAERDGSELVGCWIRAFVGVCGVCQHVVEQTSIGDGPRQRTHVIARTAERNHAVAGDFTKTRLEADEPARRGGDTYRAACVGADRGERHAGGNRNRGAAARAARHAVWRHRVPNRAVCRFLARRAECELVQVGLADQDRARASQCRGDRSIEGSRCTAVSHVRGRRGRDARLIDEILERNRNAVQRTQPGARGLGAIGRLCRGERLVVRDGDERVQ